MKTRLEIPKGVQLPSQGRNSGSIPDGSATALGATQIAVDLPWLDAMTLVAGCFYRVWMEPDSADAEFVLFVGWNYACDKLIFEDGNADHHIFTPDELEIGS